MIHDLFFVPWKQLLLHTHTHTTQIHIHTCTHCDTRIHTYIHTYTHGPLHTVVFHLFVPPRSIQPMDYVGNTYFKVKGEIIQCEKYLMKALGVCVHVQHPHKVIVFSTPNNRVCIKPQLIITFLQVLELEKQVDLVQSVW